MAPWVYRAPVSASVSQSSSPKTQRNRVFFRVDQRCAVKVSDPEDSMAERQGIEPSMRVTDPPLAGARLQPLGHLSGTRKSTERAVDFDAFDVAEIRASVVRSLMKGLAMTIRCWKRPNVPEPKCGYQNDAERW